MTRRATGGPRPQGSRQLHIGEVIALSRYTFSSDIDPATGKVRLGDVLAFIDALEVCFTCGWPVHTHEFDAATRRAMHCCAHWEREM